LAVGDKPLETVGHFKGPGITHIAVGGIEEGQHGESVFDGDVAAPGVHEDHVGFQAADEVGLLKGVLGGNINIGVAGNVQGFSVFVGQGP
jgi:hypothetical protein